jgi:hypothetical protein
MFAYNNSGIADQDRNQRPETVVNHKRGPTSSRGCYQVVPVEHLVQARPASNSKCICCYPNFKQGAGHRG